MTMKHPTPALAFGLALAAAVPAWAQQPPAGATAAPTAPSTPAREVPRPDQLEPGVDTSASPPPSVAPESTSSPQDATSSRTEPSSQTAPEKTPAKASTAKTPPRASPDASPSAGNATAQASASEHGKPTSDKAHDRIELDTTDITGNRELPKVLYIVPWKRSDLGDLVGRPANSLLDEVLAPVDRDVFKRENRYYDALKPDATGTPAPAGAAAPSSAAAGSSGKP